LVDLLARGEMTAQQLEEIRQGRLPAHSNIVALKKTG
jgi:hypothetical protein